MPRPAIPLLSMPDDFLVGPVPLADLRFRLPTDLRTDAGQLRWDPVPESWEEIERLDSSEPLGGALNAFIALADHVASSTFGDAVVRFARRFGPLHARCIHAPFGRNPSGPLRCACPADDSGEPLELWARLCIYARGLAAIAIALGRDQPVDASAWPPYPVTEFARSATPSRAWGMPHLRRWDDADDWVPAASADIPPLERALGRDAYWLSGCLAKWLNDAQIGFFPGWTIDTGKPGVTLSIHSLAAALGVALTAAITASRLTVCDECGTAYEWRRRPRPDRRRYCDACREPDETGYGRNRAAKRAWWRAHRGKDAGTALS